MRNTGMLNTNTKAEDRAGSFPAHSPPSLPTSGPSALLQMLCYVCRRLWLKTMRGTVPAAVALGSADKGRGEGEQALNTKWASALHCAIYGAPPFKIQNSNKFQKKNTQQNSADIFGICGVFAHIPGSRHS